MGFSRCLFGLAILVGMAMADGPALAETRVALVIGNGAYKTVPRLPNPANDAEDVAAALGRSGFETILATDLDKAGMDEATIRFARKARNADVAMFYYSGHALQFGGVNYLAPVDAKLADEADLRRMVRVDDIVADLQQARKLRILVLDSCRDNPLADELRRSIGTTRAIPLQRGLAKIDTPEGMIVAYATQAGRTAEDGNGRNSPYTSAFLKHIEAPEEIGMIFRHVSEDVYQTTSHGQLPELSLSLIGEFYLHGKPDMAARTSAPSNPDSATHPPADAAPAPKPDAEKQIAPAETQQHREARQKEERDRKAAAEMATYLAARGDLQKLQQYLSACTICVFAEEARQATASLERSKNPEAAPHPDEQSYREARGNIALLKNYVQNCGTCSYKTAAVDEIAALESDSGTFMLKVCNKSARKASIAVMGRTTTDNDEWHVQGWWSVPAGRCNAIRKYVKGKIYLFAQEDGNPSFAWKGDALWLCVAFPGPFDRVNRDGYACQAAEKTVSFSSFSVSESSFTWDLNSLH
jgi:uncharacterized membrane protein